VSDEELARLLRRARCATSPTDDDRRRVRAALGRRLGAVAGASIGTAATRAAAAGPTAAGVSGSASLGLGAKAAVVAVVALVGAGVAAYKQASAPPAGPAATASSAAPTTAASGTRVRQEPESRATVLPAKENTRLREEGPVGEEISDRTASPAPSARTEIGTAIAPWTPAAAEGAHPAAAAAETRALQRRDPEELGLIQEMQVALRAADASRVLALVRVHEQRFPDSAFVHEREGAKTLALCIGAVPSEAGKVGQAFLDRFPLSPLGGRVRTTCGIRLAR
jgi:hypothetical protein